MNLDVAAANRLVTPVVVHGCPGRAVRDLDPEGVRSRISAAFAIHAGQHEAVAPSAIDGAGALELGPALAGDDEPLIGRALEVEAAGLELEAGIATRHIRALEVLRDEAKAGLAGRRGIRRIGAGRTGGP